MLPINRGGKREIDVYKLNTTRLHDYGKNRDIAGLAAGVIEAEPLNNLSDRGSLHMSEGQHRRSRTRCVAKGGHDRIEKKTLDMLHVHVSKTLKILLHSICHLHIPWAFS